MVTAALSVTVLIGIGIAHAADLRLKPPQPASAPFSWAGFYVGGNLGGTWDRGSVDPAGFGYSLPPFAFNDPGGLFNGAPGLVFVPGTFPLPGALVVDSSIRSSFLGGVQVGHNWQTGPWVYGVEGQADGLKVSRAFAFAGPSLTFAGISTFASEGLNGAGTIEREFEGSLRGRLGRARDRLLVYGTGGVAVTGLRARGALNYNLTLGPGLTPAPGITNPSSGGATSDNSKTLVGATIGAGVEYAVSPHATLGVEYRHTFYSRQDVNLGTTPTLSSLAGFGAPAVITPGTPVIGNYQLDTDEVVVRLNWLLNR
jgi:outer membrane immunogenic protein